MLIESLAPMTIKLPDGDVRRLNAGQVVDLPDEQARKLLERAPGKVRKASPVSFAPSSLVWWLSADGQTRGPAVLRGTLQDQGKVWTWLKFCGVEYLIRADLISKTQDDHSGLIA